MEKINKFECEMKHRMEMAWNNDIIGGRARLRPICKQQIKKMIMEERQQTWAKHSHKTAHTFT